MLNILLLVSRGVTVHKYDGSVRTSVLTSQFGIISVQQGEKLINLFIYFKWWFTEQVALSLNAFSYSLNFLGDKNLPQLMLKIGEPFYIIRLQLGLTT